MKLCGFQACRPCTTPAPRWLWHTPAAPCMPASPAKRSHAPNRSLFTELHQGREVPIGMGTEFGTFVGTDRIPMVLPSTDSHKIKRYYVSSGQFSMVDMNTALHVQEHNDVSSRWCRQQSKHG
ncbi:hypothetical protein ATANTOWER_020768 [Ataeniobius toweri]|uniref:Uncharacterized protein n=1 Tax=Ataeniobius toweri TaxID=208326 RepID=A0ABU7CBZ7_9TELE|nr:hypothetical protein [Ataeniobius toweri]